MKNSLILLPLFLLLAIIIFFIFTSQLIAKETANDIQNITTFIEKRVDDTWLIEEGLVDASELLISINGNIIHGDRLRYRLMNDFETINILTHHLKMIDKLA
tara:strand:+ start:225 stop:530 length:306 start_codon:yes stop_codon:yes gene_type:complete